MRAGTLVRAAERRREAPEAVDATARGAREGWEADEGHEGGEGLVEVRARVRAGGMDSG